MDWLAGIPIFHIHHDAGPGSPYDVNGGIGGLACVNAQEGTSIIVAECGAVEFRGLLRFPDTWFHQLRNLAADKRFQHGMDAF